MPGTKVAQPSASSLSGGSFQRQSMPQAAPSSGHPRPISHLGGAGTHATQAWVSTWRRACDEGRHVGDRVLGETHGVGGHLVGVRVGVGLGTGSAPGLGSGSGPGSGPGPGSVSVPRVTGTTTTLNL
eukprot:scaffold70944_cov60-Phaeocystis_antarctica.AAC.5